MASEFVFLLFVWLICGIIAAVIADSRGASGGLGLLAGFLLGPLGILVAFILDPVAPPASAATQSTDRLVRCPHCAELVQAEALLCKHCRSRLANRCAWCQRRIPLPAMPCAALKAEQIRDQWPIGDERCQTEATARSLP